MNALGHSVITRAAIDVLPEPEQAWFGKEKDFLIDVYCHFPDINWPWFGQWGGEQGDPSGSRTQDLRREWNISYYCGWDPCGKKTELRPPARQILSNTMPLPSVYPVIKAEEQRFCPMGAYWAPEFYLPKIIEALQEGAFVDGVRFLGVLVHHIEDRVAFSYWPDLHKKGNLLDMDMMQIKGYSPEQLGRNLEDAIKNIEKRMRESVEFELPRIPLLEQAYADKDSEKIENIILEFYQEAGRAAADTIHTVIQLVDGNHYTNYWGYWIEYPVTGNPTMVNLIDNPSFETNDGSGYPSGWVIKWLDINDKLGKAEWDWSRMHSCFSKMTRSGERSLKLMWTPAKGIEWIQRWPSAVMNLSEGEKYESSSWMKTKDATGESYFIIYLYDGIKLIDEFKSRSICGNCDWTKIILEFTIPPGVDRMRFACRSDNNQGAVWFDDLEIMRLDT
jgi:hypothetical protein